jgi:hypothetical protein
MSTAASDWQDFEKRVMSPAATAVQRSEMHMAFYAGYWCMVLNAKQIDTFASPGQRAAALDSLFIEVQQIVQDRITSRASQQKKH